MFISLTPYFFISITLCTTTTPCFDLSCRYIFRGTFVPSILRPHADVDTDINTKPNANISKVTDGNTDTKIDVVIDARVYTDVSRFCNVIQLFVDSVTNTHRIIILSSGSSAQPLSRGVENTRWKIRTTSHSSTKKVMQTKTKMKPRVEIKMRLKMKIEMKISTTMEVKTNKMRTMVTIKWRSQHH
ncbi:hypothetical protein PVK06_040093 [Gossypium arboreum]|uniref:Uncharacterized protein n=1 Tax=Gossypium arboreum TaxID=29729 RepID=A0ABR0N6Q7_GOSAR|nr:hypothetical protein PVK06_040093 [Gossypium arboreum]